jgi:hypothetical protein
MTTKQLLLAFFEAENKRDWAAYRSFLSPDILWELHAGSVKIIRGIDDYLAAITTAYQGSDNAFVCEALHQSGNSARIVTILRNNLGERSCDIFEFTGGLIVREYEFILA